MMTEQEKQDYGITPELEAKGTFNAMPPAYEPAAANKPEPEPEPAAEPKPEPGKEAEAAPKPKPEPAAEPKPADKDKELRSRFRDRINKLGNLLRETEETQKMLLEKYNKAEGREDLRTIYAEQSEAEERKLLSAQKQMIEEYDNGMKEFAGEDYGRLKQLAGKYSLEVGKDREFSKWFVEHPRHYEAMYCLYEAFNSGKLGVDNFAGMILDDKKRLVETFCEKLDEVRGGGLPTPPPSEPAKPAEPAKSVEPPPPAADNGKPLPKVDGHGGDAAAEPDDVRALFDKYRAKTIARIRGK